MTELETEMYVVVDDEDNSLEEYNVRSIAVSKAQSYADEHDRCYRIKRVRTLIRTRVVQLVLPRGS